MASKWHKPLDKDTMEDEAWMLGQEHGEQKAFTTEELQKYFGQESWNKLESEDHKNIERTYRSSQSHARRNCRDEKS